MANRLVTNSPLFLAKHCSLANPILMHRHPHTSLPVSTPSTIHHSRLTVCLTDSLDLDCCLSILFWLSACEYVGSCDFAFVGALEIRSLQFPPNKFFSPKMAKSLFLPLNWL